MASIRSSVLPAPVEMPLVADSRGRKASPLIEIRSGHKDGPGPVQIDNCAVKEQLARVLGSLFFRNSDRYTGLLQYVVDSVLRGDHALVKERLIGINVFGRDPSYDTVKDNVVRIAAAEVRGRLVRYYALPEHRNELRIVLSPGSYVPQFLWPDLTEKREGSENERSALQKFWSPLIESVEPILIVLGPSRNPAQKRTLRVNSEPTSDQKYSEQISLSDALTLSRIVSLLESYGREYRVEMQDFVRFRDLRNGPAVLLGGLNNQWSLSFAEHLRFAFKSNRGCTRTWIRDANNPSRQDWSRDWSHPSAPIAEDHAIVARVLRSVTGRAIVIAGGHTAHGTASAGEFITTTSCLESVNNGMSFDWDSSNFELVVSTTVVRGVSGPPRIAASFLW